MSGVPPTLTPDDSARLTRFATFASVGVALVLVTVKAFAWTASGSVALLASLVDSGLDLLASLVTLFAVRYAAVPPDAKHRFGHGKAEAFASLMQAGLVFASSALIAREAFHAMTEPHTLHAEGWGVAVMIASIALTVALVAFQGRVVRRTGSVAISGDRAHYASDLGSNLVALVGIGAAAYLGLHSLDAPAGLLIAAILL